MDAKVLKWFGHVERLSGKRLSQRVCVFEVEGSGDRGRPCMRWLDRVEKACYVWSIELSDAKVMCMDTEQLRDFVDGINGGVSVYGVTENALEAKQ